MNPMLNPLATIQPGPPKPMADASIRQGGNPMLDWLALNGPSGPAQSNKTSRENPLANAVPTMTGQAPMQGKSNPLASAMPGMDSAPVAQQGASGMPYGDGQPQQGNPLGAAFGSFARGFLGPERTGQLDAAHAARGNEKLTKTLAWLQQTAQQPTEQRAAFTQRFAQQIAADTGQPVEAIMASINDPNGFSDQSIQQGIAALSAQLGQGPEAAEYMNLGGGNVGMTQGGRFSMAREAPQERAKPIEVNGRLVDPNTYEVLGDFSDPEKSAEIDWQTHTDASGNVWQYDPNNPSNVRKVPVPAARVPGTGGDGPQLTPYQMYQIQRDADKDAANEKTAKVKTENAMYSLQEGIGLVNQLVNHEGFKSIYGVQGALPITPGTASADAAAMLEQIGGQAFLAGVETMRGTGPLSDNEGRKVAAARTRLLNRAQSPEAAALAAQEFNASMQRLLDAYEQESGIKLQPPTAPQPPQAAPQYTPQEVQQAQAALQNFSMLPANLQTPEMRARLESVVASAQPQRAPTQPAPQTQAPQPTPSIPGLTPDEARRMQELAAEFEG